MPNLSRDVRKQLKSSISKMSDEATDLVVNLSGKYIDRKKREKLRKEAVREFSIKVEEAYRKGLEIEEKFRQEKFDATSAKIQIYSLTDTFFKPFMPDIPKNEHALDYLFRISEELLRNFLFNWRYSKKTKYTTYLHSLEKLMNKLKKESRINQSWELVREFIASKDFYPLLQATLQRIMKHYDYLTRNFPKIKKKELSRCLEIYEELSGVYEKFISLTIALIELLKTNIGHGYETARKRGYIEIWSTS